MQPIGKNEIKSREEYEALRPDFRRKIMVLKNKRRVPCGPNAMFHFETRDTMLYQVHEMLRAEGTFGKDEAIEDELHAYNPLVPAGRNLTATLMFEYETATERDEKLSKLVGIDESVFLQIGDAERVLAKIDHAQVSETRISSVQYLEFPIGDEHAAALKQPGSVVRVSIEHPNYQAQAVLSEETREELAKDVD